MNALEFEKGLNVLIIEGIKSLPSGQIKAADIVYLLEVQRHQVVQMCIMQAMAAQQQKQQSGIIVPRNGEIPPNLR